MKNIILGFSLLFLLASCKQTITEKDIENLNGYWEIEKVDLPEGKIKPMLPTKLLIILKFKI